MSTYASNSPIAALNTAIENICKDLARDAKEYVSRKGLKTADTKLGRVRGGASALRHLGFSDEYILDCMFGLIGDRFAIDSDAYDELLVY